MSARKRMSKRLLRLHAKYGPFVRFSPDGNEDPPDPGAGDGEPGITDPEAGKAAIKDAEPSIEDSPQFKGLLRARQADRLALAAANASATVAQAEVERLNKASAEAKGPTEPEMSEEEANEGVTRGEMKQTLNSLSKNIIDKITTSLNDRDVNNNKRSLARNQAADAKALKTTHTTATRGNTLDATTVVNETAEWLAQNNPDLLAALRKQPDFASLLYKMGSGESLVPSIGVRAAIRRNTILASKLDQSGNDVPGGGEPGSEALDAFESILAGGEEMSDEKLDQYFSET